MANQKMGYGKHMKENRSLIPFILGRFHKAFGTRLGWCALGGGCHYPLSVSFSFYFHYLPMMRRTVMKRHLAFDLTYFGPLLSGPNFSYPFRSRWFLTYHSLLLAVPWSPSFFFFFYMGFILFSCRLFKL
ncbi:hypothetical protein SODALDRAFT_189642 [Sodiomyces alkalinus F11]|uniref:Uncharacterized protein n=1 Tax=Sodiomyces alkalinus (strain CBS 110278 / VKM F-3762 / F11) TaxID=1314773 RepID=A0A3N2PRN1_SODAK|nr:hypothetical protein SODALDRAFT_189642 [Sodiomyces alkalinus F11]ROT37157.1 hypothetical protein SODALDRAFT_189642 [Sodiomyces alkalinus F11]